MPRAEFPILPWAPVLTSGLGMEAGAQGRIGSSALGIDWPLQAAPAWAPPLNYPMSPRAPMVNEIRTIPPWAPLPNGMIPILPWAPVSTPIRN